MQKLIVKIINVFLYITIITALLTLSGILFIWYSGKSDLPYLNTLTVSVIIEIIGVVLTFTIKGLKFLPEVVITKELTDTTNFMKKFFNNASSITIVSNRVSWLSSNDALIKELRKKTEKDIRIEIITPKKLDDNLIKELNNVTFIVTNETNPPEARFTLINADRRGCERLAIARGIHPEHEITIFDNNSGPQIISMAKDIIKKNKERSNA